ncbi:methyl-accepting chemotaxis protein [Methylobacterium planeticum]|uniref:PAS domain S-box protein n=1 Tax=Methylobacterium planeticum TaxID=2615211 RepID=A0A6N6MTR8_9HYPH|nr:PAS domain S-box protein [Methylobacterium planeticum]KAB1075258.1 PAS domain S-box protein [Methylobacterium planeticum]
MAWFRNTRGAGGDGDARLNSLDRSLSTVEFAMDGTILDANANFLALMGYELDEVQGRHHSIFVEPNTAESDAYRLFWQNLKRGKFQSAEHKRLGRGGREVWIQATYNPVLDRSGRPTRIVKFATDITAEKLSNADFRGQVSAINKSQAVLHMSLDGTLLEANDMFLRLFGYERQSVIGKHHSMFVDPGMIESWEYASFWQKLRAGAYQQGEFKRAGIGGREVWIQATYNPIFDADGRPFKVVKFATDVTEAKLRAADHGGQFEAISRSQAVIQFDLNGVVLDANENFCDAMGYRIGEVRGQHHRMFVTPAYAASREYEEFWQRLRRGEFFSAIFARIGRNGRTVSIQATYNPILDLNGKPFKIVKYATDVTVNMEARALAVASTAQTLSNVQSVAAAAEEMSASVAEIAEVMVRSKDAVDGIHGKAHAADQAQRRLRAAAQSMDGVVQAITKIAEQINLLALNATIEAVRAGEAGKGFAIVANEVKNLANQATVATAQILTEITAMQAVSDEVADTLSSITLGVASVQEFVTQATASIEEQSAVTREISVSMQAAAIDVRSIGEGLTAWA